MSVGTDERDELSGENLSAHIVLMVREVRYVQYVTYCQMLE